MTLPIALVLCLGAGEAGHVQIPVEVYNSLVAHGTASTRPAPAGYALGNARVTVVVKEDGARGSAQVHAELTIEVLEDQWVLVPVLPAGTAVDSATVGGAPVQLVASPAGLAWATNRKGSYALSLAYRVDAQRSPGGFALPLPVPQAPSLALSATLPGTGLDVTVIPAAGTRVTASGGATRVEATVPATGAVQLSWRTPSLRGHSLSRAHYTGRLEGENVTWTAELGVEVFSDETASVGLLPRGVTLSVLSVDGKQSPVLVEGDRFATLVKGVGSHTVRLGFQTPVVRGEGPPHVELQVPPVPISRFDLTLPGRKELKAAPGGSVTLRETGGATVATVYSPLADRVSLAWSEAVPEAVKAEVRANASIFHVAYAEEGVLYVHARVQYEVARGATNRIQLLVPAGAQLNRIESPSGAVADWRLGPATAGRRVATVFLDRELTGELLLDVYYDRALGAPGEDLDLPLLSAPDAQRQRGMLALLATPDLTLDPRDESVATRVGENQLPPFVRETIDKTVAHTFKYADEPKRFPVRARTPDPVAARFDAQVDTLVSLGEAAVTAAASAQVQVKSGKLGSLQIELPKDVNLLSLTGPSIRSQHAAVADGVLLVDVSFTQELEGEFRLELRYERLLPEAQAESRAEAPTLRVRGAEVEQGRIAVEALSAVEVRPASAEQLTAVDVSELPRQLVLRTTNPILMAYKYLHAEPRHRLVLGLNRHRLAGVQEAVIDRAEYRTLYTRDGLQVTTAELRVRNSRKQFLRLQLPKGAEVWSVFVDGRPEKPAMSDEKGQQRTVLIKIVNSTAGFPVQVVYGVQGPRFGSFGSARGALPRPDVLVTRTRWDVYVPAGLRYAAPSSNLDVVGSGGAVGRDEMARMLGGAEAGDGKPQILDPLRIAVPTSGIHFAFEKLYANQADRDAWIALPYASTASTLLGRLTSSLGALAFWLGLALFLRAHSRLPIVPSRVSLAILAAGLTTVLVSTGLLHVGSGAALLVSLLAALTAVALQARRVLGQRWLKADS